MLDIQYDAVQDPQPEILLKAKLQFAKKRMFDFIQKLQQKNRDERQVIYTQIKSIDEDIDQAQSSIQKVRDKELRTKLMEEFVLFKQQAAAVARIMGQDTREQIDNLLIAQLNDVAYKAIRKTGV